MRIAFAAAGAVLAVGALAGCASPAPAPSHPALPAIYRSGVDPDARPGFLDSPQTAADRLPAGAEIAKVAPDSTRYQGRWDGREYYLGVSGTATVDLISFPIGQPSSAGTGSSMGNVVIGTSAAGEDRIGLVYLPQGTAHPAKGWTALSDWLAIRD